MKKKYYLVAILLMVVGFAAVSTTLYLSGSTNIIGKKDDFKVYYSDAKVNGVQDLSIVESETSLRFSTELDTLGQTYVIEYDVTNSSKNYDADLTMECTGGDEYLSVVNNFDDVTNLAATETRVGTLILTLAQSYSGVDYDVNIACTITANAVERTTLGDGEVPLPVEPVVSDEAQLFCESNGYSYGMFVPTTYADDLEDPDHGESSNEYYYCSNDEDYENYDGYDENGVLVSVNGVEVLDAETFCSTKGYDYGMLNVSTYEMGGSTSGDINDAYYLCSSDDFSCDIYGYDLNGNVVYETIGGCTDEQ